MTIISEFRVIADPLDESIYLLAVVMHLLVYSKCRDNRYGKILPQKIHFGVQKMLKMNFLKTNWSKLIKKYINEREISKIA